MDDLVELRPYVNVYAKDFEAIVALIGRWAEETTAADRGGLRPADVEAVRKRVDRKVEDLQAAGQDKAQLYLDDPADGIGGGGAFFLLLDEPEVYGLPPDPVVTTRDLPGMWKHVAIAAAGLAGAAVAFGLGRRR